MDSPTVQATGGVRVQGEGLSEPKKLLSEQTGLGGQEEKHTAGVLESWRQRNREARDLRGHSGAHTCARAGGNAQRPG